MVGDDFGRIRICRTAVYVVRNSTFRVSDGLGDENETGKCVKVFGISLVQREAMK